VKHRITLLLGLAAVGFTLAVGAVAGRDYFLRGLGSDYQSRWVESRYVRQGVNPIDPTWWRLSDPERDKYVRRGVHPTLGSGRPAVRELKDCGVLPVFPKIGYPPWSYSYLEYTLGWLPYPASKAAFWLVDLVLWAGIWVWCYRRGKDLRGSWMDGLFLLGASLCTIQFLQALRLGNYGVLCAACLFGMAWAEKRRLSVCAGVFLALMMIKPQLGFLPGLYFVAQRRWKPLALAVLLVVAAWAAAAWQLHQSPLALLGQMSQVGLANSSVGNVGILAPCAYYGWLTLHGTLLVSGALGAAATLALLLKYRRLAPEYQLCIPAVFGVLWTFSWSHGWVVLALPVALIAETALRQESRLGWTMLSLFLAAYALPSLVRLYEHTAGVWINPEVRYVIWIAGLVWLLRAASAAGAARPGSDPVGTQRVVAAS
jgi:hypothetical protein